MVDSTSKRTFRPATELVRAGRMPFEHEGFVNTPIYRGSTVLSRTAEEFLAHKGRYTYGRRGTPTTDALSVALAALEGGAGVVLTPSGLSAITTALLAVLKSGDHLLMVDTAYNPTRVFCNTVLSRLGVEITYYDPLVGAGIADLLRPHTRAIFLEAPGSLSFEMQDIPAITAVARTRGVVTVMDNTWATPLHFKPHDFGVDLSLEAGTKYLGGHADLNLGWVSATKEHFTTLKDTCGTLGLCPGPEDTFLALRGFRTLGVRLERHMQAGLKVARWLAQHPEGLRGVDPALQGAPGRAHWRRH